MKSKNIVRALVFSLACIALPVRAGSLACTGTIDALAYHSLNGLMIRLSSMNSPVFFCDPDSNWTVSGTVYTTPPQTCKALWASFMAAKEAGRPVTVMYFDGDDVPAACDSWGAWKRANIRYYSY